MLGKAKSWLNFLSAADLSLSVAALRLIGLASNVLSGYFHLMDQFRGIRTESVDLSFVFYFVFI